MGCYIKHVDPYVESLYGRFYRRGGNALFMCGQGWDDPHCANCGDIGDYLCDYPVGEGKTCDKALCDKHRHFVSPIIDYCDTHYPEWCKYRDSGAALKHFETVIPFRVEKYPA